MKILVIDIETTGFISSNGHIVEVGIVELDLTTGSRVILFDEVVHEDGMSQRELDNAWIIQNSDLEINEVDNSCNLESYLPKIQQIIDEHPEGATAYNRGFDFDFLEDRGIVFNKKLPCPMKVATPICKLPGNYGDYKWPKVEECYKFLFPLSNYDELHRGADDAMHEAEIVFEFYKWGKYKLEDS